MGLMAWKELRATGLEVAAVRLPEPVPLELARPPALRVRPRNLG